MCPAHSQYEVTIVKYGTRVTSRSDVYLNYQLYNEADGAMEMDYFFWVIHGGGRTVLVDTGFSPEGGRARKRDLLADVAELLQRFGASPDTAPPVILTHAHYDHVGNLGLFSASEVFMARREFEFWASGHARRKMFHHSVDDEGLALLAAVQAEGRLRLFGDSIEVVPGVEVLRVGGHTPGQCVVKVPTSEGTVLLASDAIHYYEEYERDMLFMSVANLVEMYEGFDYVRRLVDSGQVDHLVAGHDPSTLARFKPVEGRFGHLAATIGQSGPDRLGGRR